MYCVVYWFVCFVLCSGLFVLCCDVKCYYYFIFIFQSVQYIYFQSVQYIYFQSVQYMYVFFLIFTRFNYYFLFYQLFSTIIFLSKSLYKLFLMLSRVVSFCYFLCVLCVGTTPEHNNTPPNTKTHCFNTTTPNRQNITKLNPG